MVIRHTTFHAVADLALTWFRGSAGVVHLAINNATGEEVAVKLIERAGRSSSTVLRAELINHSALGNHPHVIALKACTLLRFLHSSTQHADAAQPVTAHSAAISIPCGGSWFTAAQMPRLQKCLSRFRGSLADTTP